MALHPGQCKRNSGNNISCQSILEGLKQVSLDEDEETSDEETLEEIVFMDMMEMQILKIQ